MKVADAMSKKVVVASSGAGFQELWKKIFAHRINAIPIVDSGNRLIGIVTREDLLKILYPTYRDLILDFTVLPDFEEMEMSIRQLSTKKAKDVMNKRVVFTRKDTEIMRALSRMIVRQVDQLPVIDEAEKVVGMITKGDIFYALAKKNFLLKTTKKGKKENFLGKK
ncbi:MAG: CBS protein [uncultured bacterium]|uniref:CBS domain-containing protein n=1 Tax=Candidatus Gottesmanbacteria bacterium RIFCSPLOWO2_01_FULL_43_11b TaxID=1798392 RepID=A0A1F6AJK8_9BACT|nr:MAG: CBS protein [uncultured bacterium]OGG24623.1 MAG: hypothetical protein A3A79_05595 [Candidatus Gottesmanbacteria bacterium RIFCSPLOWO2_01_FULL_43_11b]